MKRREFIRFVGGEALAAVLVAAFSTTLAWSQPPDKPRRVGLLVGLSLSDPGVRRHWQALLDGLREHGWVEGRNVIIEIRETGPDLARFPDLAKELVELKVDVIVAGNMQSIEAARRATATVPIVMAGAMNPVGLGSVASLARPGGNVTGVVSQLETVGAKSFELLKELNPGIERVAIIYDPSNIASLAGFKVQAQEIAPRLGLAVLPIAVSKPADFDQAFATIARERPQALLVHHLPVVFPQRAKIAAFAIEQRLPTVSPVSHLTHDGMLMSYGIDSVANYRRAASYVDRILKGANPAETPVEQMDRFEFIINLNTAKALGLTIPPTLLARADEVIE
ncbi:MAG: ABC transporter substrate-binding protein [Hyphomicrobiaceae bacterium]